jgi:DNA-binding NarL/FixJ family response regulator
VNLLILEENGAMRRLLATLLDGLTVAISECSDGARIVEICAASEPDYVVIDLNLASTDAFAAIQGILRTRPQVRVLLLAEEEDSRLRERAAEAGVWKFVLKESLVDVRRLIEAGAEIQEDK